MPDRADVSVIIACRNAASTLSEAVESVLRQTLPVREILIGDDASSDDTAKLADSLGSSTVPVRWLRSETNIGPASMRNRLVQAAQGAWVAILDGDDAWKQTRIESLMKISHDVDVVSDDLAFWMDGILEKGSVCQTHKFRPVGVCTIGIEEMIRFDLGLLQPLVRKEFLQVHSLAYTEGMFHAEDLDLHVRVLLKGGRWRHLPEKLYLYRKHAQSLSRNWPEGLASSLHALERLQKETGIRESSDLVRMLENWKIFKRDLEVVYTVRDHFRNKHLFFAMAGLLRMRTWMAVFRLLRTRTG
jgi:glycosyltransferase involved in cell wall biosynthesis